ncbi:MAG: DUF1232 domain-containing protein [Tetrasphaera jenkinsii]|jgi:uncharacterized membrane protein YkvA (DUF1232 family)|nr:DUF1232 domain-containing protein [Tetrasphaera jenkinsii]
MATRSRLPLLRSLATAVRSATRPGSPGFGDRLAALPRLIRATRSGQYAGTSVGRLAMLAVAAAYIVSPVDLLPEGALFVFGLADDAMVLSWLAAAFLTETESYLAWERGHAAPGAYAATPGTPFPSASATTGWPQDSVPGSVR